MLSRGRCSAGPLLARLPLPARRRHPSATCGGLLATTAALAEPGIATAAGRVWMVLAPGTDQCKEKRNAEGFASGGIAGDYAPRPCCLGEALAACSPKSTSSKIRVPALTSAVARCLCDGNGAARTEAGLPLPKATPASPHTSPGEMPPPGPPLGSAGRAAAEDVQGHRWKPPRCHGT